MERSDTVVEPQGTEPPTDERPDGGLLAGRDPHTGRFVAGNNAGAATQFKLGVPGPRLTHGLRSQLVRSGAAIRAEQAMAEARQKLRAELGECGIVKGALADSFVELTAVRMYLGDQLATAGPLTNKGNSRAILTAYLRVVEQLRLLAEMLGLESRNWEALLGDR